MNGNRKLTAIAAFAMAGMVIFSACLEPEAAAPGSITAKSSVKTAVSTLKRADVQEDSKAGTTGNKTEKEKSRSVKSEKTIKTSASAYNKAESSLADSKADAAAGGRKKSEKPKKDNTKEKTPVVDADSGMKETATAEDNAADAPETAVEPEPADTASGAPGNDEPDVPEPPAEAPAEAPSSEMPEPTESPEPAEPVHEHSWEEIMELVHHDAVYGEPPLISPAQDITYDVTEMHTICGICGANLDEAGKDHDYMHLENGEGFWYYNDYVVVGQRTEHFDAVYGDPPLITPAYDEWVGTGRYACTGCGETK